MQRIKKNNPQSIYAKVFGFGKKHIIFTPFSDLQENDFMKL